MAVFGKAIKAFAAERNQSVIASGLGPLIEDKLVDEVGLDKGLRDRGPAFNQNAGDPTMGERLQSVLRIDHAVIVDRHGNDLGTVVMKKVCIGLSLARHAKEPDRHHKVFEQGGAGRRA